MLKVRSFKFDQDDEINELFEKYPLAAGASVFVSDGQLMIPYDDGTPQNDNHKRIHLQLQINEMRGQIEVIEHSNKVLTHMIQDLHQRLQVAEADYKATPNMKDKEKLVKELKNQIDINHSQTRQNDYEIKRLLMNIDLYTEQIDKLGA